MCLCARGDPPWGIKAVEGRFCLAREVGLACPGNAWIHPPKRDFDEVNGKHPGESEVHRNEHGVGGGS
jgi:hypothetical protein